MRNFTFIIKLIINKLGIKMSYNFISTSLKTVKKLFLTFLFSLFTTTSSYAAQKVGIIVPLEHEAMKQIVGGIKESLVQTKAEILVRNAQSDPMLSLSIIKQMQQQDIDVIMPIGTMACQMTVAHIKNKPIICTAALIDTTKHPLVTGINDEIAVTETISKLPTLKKITLIYSSSEKIIPEVETLKSYATKNGISLHLAMIQNLHELPLAVSSSPKDTQGFLILKDHIVVSGINILKKEAFKRSIPIIASDEGSVISGATIAIGVREKAIGVKAGIIAQKILQGTKPSDIPFETIHDLIVFINTQSFAKQQILNKTHLLALPFSQVEI
jgi:putative ABC transport system substrate-binding protein